MKKLLHIKIGISGILILCASMASGQKHLKNWLNERIDKDSKLIDYGVLYSVEKTKNKHFIYRQYIPGTEHLTHVISYKDKGRTIRHGQYTEWFSNGKLRRLGNYLDNKKVGNWKLGYKDYTENGNFINDLKQGEWISYDLKGRILERISFKDNKPHGSYTKFDTLGQIRITQEFDGGNLTATTFRIDSTELGYQQLIKPMFPGCEDVIDIEEREKCASEKMLYFIYTRLKYPRDDRLKGNQGVNVVEFVINKEGEIVDPKVVNYVSPTMAEACLNVIAMMPKWNPATKNGVPVEHEYIIPISFRIEGAGRKNSTLENAVNVVGYGN